MTEWTTKQLAMEMIARGYSVQGAISTAREFDRQWEPEAAREDARMRAFKGRVHMLPAHPTPEQEHAWALETMRLANAAGEAAAQAVLDARVR